MKLLAALLIMALPAWAAAPVGCASLCGSWKLDTALSEPVAATVDAALHTYRDPRARQMRKGDPNDTLDQIDAEMERSLGPIRNRPQRRDLRSELMALLTAPAQLNLDARGTEILITGDNLVARRLSPGTPRARVDSYGTARINGTWKTDQLRITERYDRRRGYSETYALQRADGTLLVTREVQRPGLKPLRVRFTYRRA